MQEVTFNMEKMKKILFYVLMIAVVGYFLFVDAERIEKLWDGWFIMFLIQIPIILYFVYKLYVSERKIAGNKAKN